MSVNRVEEQIEDLSTCCVCLEFYNDGERKPKFLSCHHCLCLKCILVSGHEFFCFLLSLQFVITLFPFIPFIEDVFVITSKYQSHLPNLQD